MHKKWMIITGITGALAVAIGAFGAHGLKPLLTDYQLDIFNTGNEYHFFHTLAIAITAIIMHSQQSKYLKISINAFVIGIVLFSGSLYLLAVRDVLGISSWTWLGPITPLGGLSFIVGWVCLALHFIFSEKDKQAQQEQF